MTVVALTPDLGDRGRIAAAVPDARFVGAAAALDAAVEPGDVVVVDATRAGALEAIEAVAGRAARVVAFGPHVAADLLAAAHAAGAESVPRSRFFRDPAAFTSTKQS